MLWCPLVLDHIHSSGIQLLLFFLSFLQGTCEEYKCVILEEFLIAIASSYDGMVLREDEVYEK